MKAKPRKKPGEVILELNRRDEPLMDAATRTVAKSPFTLKRILVPIDFSDCSKKALQYALPLARSIKPRSRCSTSFRRPTAPANITALITHNGRPV
jgi:hypothetical protein